MEQVVSHGTEGRRGDPAKEIAGSENVYEYIVFRGGDVKDLRIEETASQPRPQVPDDPAILGVRLSSLLLPPYFTLLRCVVCRWASSLPMLSQPIGRVFFGNLLLLGTDFIV